MDDELIKFIDVTKRFGKKGVVEDLNLTIPENKITGIIGASGEGKTTLLKLLVGFYKPNKGEILYLRRSVFKEDLKETFGFSTEDGSFHSRLTVLENLCHFASLHKVPRSKIKKRAKELMEFVELEYAQNTLAGDLSMGMKKRLDVTISLMHNPSVLIMDEPTADLDPLLRNKMIELIKKVKNKGTTIILTTQILIEMDKICDKIAILFEKKILHQGKPSEIKKKYGASNLDDVFNKIFSKRNKAKTERAKKEELTKEDNKEETERVKKEELTKEQIEKIQEKIDLSMKRGEKNE